MRDNIKLLLLVLPFAIIAGVILLSAVNLNAFTAGVIVVATILCGGLFTILLLLIGAAILNLLP